MRCPYQSGGRAETRTLGPLIKSQLLYQLSYAPRRRRFIPCFFEKSKIKMHVRDKKVRGSRKKPSIKRYFSCPLWIVTRYLINRSGY